MVEKTSEYWLEKARKAHNAGDYKSAKKAVDEAKRIQKLDPSKSLAAGALRSSGETIDFFGGLTQKILDLPLEITKKIQLLDLISPTVKEKTGLDLGTSEDIAIPKRDPDAPTVRQKISEITGGFSEYQPQTVGGEFTGTLGEFLGGAATMPLGGLFRSTTSAVLPALASETAGQLTKGTEYENLARFAGALGVPIAQAGATPLLRRTAIGDPTEVQAYVKGSTRPESVDLLKQLGVEDISAGQKLGSEALMRLEGRLGPSLPSQGQLTRAVAKEAGIDTGDDVLQTFTVNANRKRLGAIFNQADDLAGGIPTQDEAMKAINLVSDAEALMSEGVKIPKVLTNAANTIGNAFADNTSLNAETIKQVRANINKAIKTYSKAIDKRIEYDLAENLLNALDDMVARQISTTSPQFMNTLNTARQQYRAHLTLERALTGGGQKKAAGVITPESLASATLQREGVSYTRGTGTDLADIARASQEVLTPLPRVAEGGIRFGPSGRAGQILDVIPSMYASRAQQTLPLNLRQAVFPSLFERIARQTGGLLSID